MTRIIWNEIHASGRRTSWAKPFDRVDPNVKGAKAFYLSTDPLRPGGYLQDEVETELPEGTLILEVRPEGSVKNGSQLARILRVASANCHGTPLYAGLDILSRDYDWRKEYLSLVDEASEALDRCALADDSDSNPLAEYTKEQLLAELERRSVAWYLDNAS